MTPPTGRTTHRGRPGYSRDEVISTAVEVFIDHGYDATSMGLLAQKLGISKSAIYHHITTKEELLEEAINRALNALEQVIDQSGEGLDEAKEPAITQLRRLVRGTTVTLCSETPYVALLLRLRGNSPVELAAMQRRREFTNFLIEVVIAAQKEGTVRDDLAPQVLGRLLFGSINSLTEWYRPSGPLTPEELATTIEAIAFEGIRSLAPTHESGRGGDPSPAAV
ncbi:TetR/AcrR family transcriptional regulator [Corynebacterium vitaeruminis]|uniref:HTH tetR-type domain-containing protein n=1 Tax=Corynebacterium vitaeruminis DSM 20294 TaxID=1224164 RepID=W5YAC2_9CORY|nr:TetR/AcrR family transcriptional regulator [Corynebacterium vitaeruminis]AHI23478.1 hypothetical protein B843_10490 [Corynebacterium vitaeruminis DSM 20294]